jgi:DNA-binding NarL/FixJ family response regulator
VDLECRLCSYVQHAYTDLDDLIERVSLLTPKREVFDFLGPGLSISEIASALGIHPSTVKAHVRAILAKLETDRRTAGLVALLLHHGRCPQRTSSELADTVVKI